MSLRVVQERLTRSTGTVVQVVDRGHDRIGPDRWATVCVDPMTREELLGEPDDVEFLQPKRPRRDTPQQNG